MTRIKAAGRLLTANAETRTLNYLLLPFGEPGSTNLGKVTASRGSITIPADPTTLVANDEHDYKRPLGRFVNVTETDAGLEAAVRVLNTRAGDDLLAEASEGVKTGISVEIDSPVIRAGKLVAGLLAGAGFVVRPAFPSAQLTASDVGDAPDDEEPNDDQQEEEQEPEVPEEKKPETPLAADAPAAPQALLAQLATMLTTGNGGAAEPQLEAAGPSAVDQMVATMFGLGGTTDPTLVAAAFDTITQADIYDATSVPQYVDELWKGRVRPQLYAPLVNQSGLTSMVVQGWRIVKKPAFADWDPAYSGTAPNETMTDIPTNEVTFEPESFTAKRIARGSRFDRIHVDFPNPAAMAVFLREETQALSDLLDEKVKDFIVASAKTVTANGADKADPWAKLVFGCANVLEYSIPTFAIVGNDLWRAMKGTAEIDRRAWLASELGLEAGQVEGFKLQPARISDTEMNGKVIVGAKPAINFRTPPGAPIRVDAQELQKGAVDKAVFSYYELDADPDATALGGISTVVDGA